MSYLDLYRTGELSSRLLQIKELLDPATCVPGSAVPCDCMAKGASAVQGSRLRFPVTARIGGRKPHW